MTRVLSDQLTFGPPLHRKPHSKAHSKLNRRAALKLMAGGAATVVLPATAAIAGQSADAGFTGSPLSPAPLSASMTIEIFTGSATPEDTVLLSSTSSYPLMLRQFAPGLVALGGRAVDLNQILTKDGLMIRVGAMHAAALPMRQPKSALGEYLVVDAAEQEAVQKIGDGTAVITVHAVVDANGTAVVYIPQTEGVTGIA